MASKEEENKPDNEDPAQSQAGYYYENTSYPYQEPMYYPQPPHIARYYPDYMIPASSQYSSYAQPPRRNSSYATNHPSATYPMQVMPQYPPQPITPPNSRPTSIEEPALHRPGPGPPGPSSGPDSKRLRKRVRIQEQKQVPSLARATAFRSEPASATASASKRASVSEPTSELPLLVPAHSPVPVLSPASLSASSPHSATPAPPAPHAPHAPPIPEEDWSSFSSKKGKKKNKKGALEELPKIEETLVATTSSPASPPTRAPTSVPVPASSPPPAVPPVLQLLLLLLAAAPAPVAASPSPPAPPSLQASPSPPSISPSPPASPSSQASPSSPASPSPESIPPSSSSSSSGEETSQPYSFPPSPPLNGLVNYYRWPIHSKPPSVASQKNNTHHTQTQSNGLLSELIPPTAPSPPQAKSLPVIDSKSEETETSTLPIPLDLEKDVTVQFELDVEEDVLEELESFSRLKKLGHFQEANHLFEATLITHCDFFPVLVEYADLLLEQGRYEYLIQFFESQLANGFWDKHHTSEELFLLRLMEHVARMYSEGVLSKALDEARAACTFLSTREYDAESSFGEVSMHLLELCVHVFAFASQTSDFVCSKDTQPPWIKDNSLKDWAGYGEWHQILWESGYRWEAQKLLRILLPVLNQEQVSKVFLHGMDLLAGCGVLLQQLKECLKIRTESSLLVVLSAISTWGRYLTGVSWTYSNQKAHTLAKQFFEEAQSVANLIVQERPDDVNSRSYLEWMLGEEELARVGESKASGHLFNSFHSLYYDLIVFANGPAEAPPNVLATHIQDRSDGEETPNSTGGNMYGFLPLILSTAQNCSDYRIQAECLREFAVARRYNGDMEGSIQELDRLVRLQRDTMVDIPGLLNSLNLQWAIINTPEGPTVQASEDLYSKFAHFDRMFLDPGYTYTDEKPSQNTSFGIPLLRWGQLRAQRALSKVMGRKLQSALIETEAALMKNTLPAHSYSVSEIPTAFSHRPISEDQRDVGEVDLREVKAVMRRLQEENHQLRSDLKAAENEVVEESASDYNTDSSGPTTPYDESSSTYT